MAKRLKDIDSGERAMTLQLAFKLGIPLFFVLAFAEYVMLPGAFLMLLIPDLVLTACVVWITRQVLGGVGKVAGMFLMPNSVASVREYSEQDALVIRGHVAEAIDSYRALIVSDPADLTARLRLAALLARDSGKLVAAEQCFLEVRRSNPSPKQSWIVGNGLIDLYRVSGQVEKLKRELGRLAYDHEGSEAGRHARRYLDELDG